MVNIKLGDKTFNGVEKVKLNTTDGGEVIFTPDDGSDAGYDVGYSEGFDAGKKAEYDAFWDIVQLNGNRTYYAHAFSGSGWNVDSFYPKYDIICGKLGMNEMFTNFGNTAGYRQLEPFDLESRLQELGVTLDTSLGTAATSMFSNANIGAVPELDFTGCSTLNAVFSSSKIHTIRKIKVKETLTYTSVFNGCYEMTNLTFDGIIGQNGLNVSPCTKLTHDSLMSIINCLQTKTSGTWTVTLGDTNLAKLTDAEKAIATQKGWTLG